MKVSKKFITMGLLLLFTAGWNLVYSISPPWGALSVDKNKVVDNQGNPVSLAGKSLFWSGDYWGGDKYYNSGVVNWLIEDWNATIIRAAMGVDESGGYLTNPEGNKSRVTQVVETAIEAGIYVIIDWHTHHAEDYQSQAISFFQEMAAAYGHHDNVIYEIYNEPLQVSWSNVIKPYAEAVITAIRAIDPDNLIVVGTPNWSSNVEEASFDPITDYKNIAYTLHFYAGHENQWLRDQTTRALNNGIAIVATEWGTFNVMECAGANKEETNIMMDFMAEKHIISCNWAVIAIDECSTLQPHASPNGGWAESDLTESGRFVRNIMKNWSGNVSPSSTPTPGLRGDVDGDGSISIVDALLTARYTAGLNPGGFIQENADADCDGQVSIVDAMLMARYSSGLITQFPC